MTVATKMSTKLVTSSLEPFRILALEASISFLGFRDFELKGQSILCLCRPWSETPLRSLLSEALLNGSVRKTQIQLYDKFLTSRNLVVTCSRVFPCHGSADGIIMHFECEDERLQYKQPNYFAPALHELHPGLRQEAECAAYFQPVGTIKAQLSSRIDETADGLQEPERAVRIHPRRKAGVIATSPVAITLDTIGKLQHLPVHEAALHIGISPTALKRACRKLGVDRWAYRRCGPAVLTCQGSPAPPSPTRPLAKGPRLPPIDAEQPPSDITPSPIDAFPSPFTHGCSWPAAAASPEPIDPTAVGAFCSLGLDATLQCCAALEDAAASAAAAAADRLEWFTLPRLPSSDSDDWAAPWCEPAQEWPRCGRDPDEPRSGGPRPGGGRDANSIIIAV